MTMAIASPGRNVIVDRDPRNSLTLAETVPKMAVEPPCIMAVPMPRIALAIRPVAERSGI
jgi:hypothetical protein